MGFGVTEAVIVLVILLVLFAPTLIAFWLGYSIGTKRSSTKPAQPSGPAETPETPTDAPEEP